MHFIPPPTWPEFAKEARKMRKFAASLLNPEERQKAEYEALKLELKAQKQKALDDRRK
ncbi:MAG: hypothetical protein WBX25_35680 [Rhodomicrobium sp.]